MYYKNMHYYKIKKFDNQDIRPAHHSIINLYPETFTEIALIEQKSIYIKCTINKRQAVHASVFTQC